MAPGKKPKKAPSLSSRHRISYGAKPVAKTVPLNKTGSQIQIQNEKLTGQITALSFLQREQLFGQGDYDIEMPDMEHFPADGWEDVDKDAALQTLPPGEEGLYHSHEGKEAIFTQIFEKCRPGRGDARRRAFRVQRMVNAWNEQMPILVDAYLALAHDGPLNSDEEALACVQRTNETLIRHGYIGASPEKVSVAFPLRLFEIYRQVHRVCPRYSLGALSRTLTNLAEVPRRRNLAEQLSTAYDAYLEIMRRVDAQASLALGRNAAWFIRNVCTPCLYKLKNEPHLKFSFLACMDGNNSLKLVDATFRTGNLRADDRAPTSFRWLTPDQVDVFKDEVADAQKRARASKRKSPPSTTPSAAPPPADVEIPADVPAVEPDAETPAVSHQEDTEMGLGEDDNGDVAWLNINELSSAEAEELANCVDTCVERWKAAGPEARKKMFMLFAIAGIFLTVCRHGHVIVMCDMIRSGELMKYPLAMIRFLLDHYGAGVGIGYDIMCAFWKTLRRSSLSPDVTAMRLQGVVPAFHGHAHNRACQIGWHPLYVDGVGLEDFEECEHTFSLSNHLASSTRLATAFHRRQQINEHFHFHDQDKHASSGNFIYQNYRQALEKIALNREQLSELERILGTTAEDYEKDHITEIEYFESLRSEPDEIKQTADYMDVLHKLYTASAASDAAKADHNNLDTLIIIKGYTRKEIAAVRTRYRTTFTRYTVAEEQACRFEEEHGIEIRWTPESKEYKDAIVLMTERKYRAAVSELERLVVMRLFELTKIGMSGVAYKLRDQISKALKTRSETIRRAIAIYNEAGATLTPPQERLMFADIISTTALIDFDMLRETREDIRKQPWTQPARREAMVLYFGIKRAKEEIQRLNVEISRLITSMLDEHVDYYRSIASTLLVNPPLATELQRRWLHVTRISASICQRLRTTSRLTGFSGNLFPGEREGRDPDFRDGVPPPHWLASALGVTSVEVEYDEPQSVDEDIDADYINNVWPELEVRELEGVDEDRLVDLMDNLITFDDQ
ncbi:hypothetical protein B0H10DRAFT_1952591 [Mycena sp. CBHHK59/15]|nr:hypothetical protein B0H10DRAFT_1952591 [Mycena sp. CBHHK59/15]